MGTKRPSCTPFDTKLNTSETQASARWKNLPRSKSKASNDCPVGERERQQPGGRQEEGTRGRENEGQNEIQRYGSKR
ncbi:hypothetical protein KUCAC02_014866 [Chaenocephalus aceratus]|uniref:Uncharacterized protein n=1 Tax=Chaenocephalus aceratus TaxID=36190 RepID=A0ACB9WGJ5_CHAAC|nr:hypothetical protein KUCAC02_014866 [Chaenocephalus aceratus]